MATIIDPGLAQEITTTGQSINVSEYDGWSVYCTGNFTTQPIVSAVMTESDGTENTVTLLTFTGLTGTTSKAIMHSPVGTGVTNISVAFAGGTKILVIGRRLTKV